MARGATSSLIPAALLASALGAPRAWADPLPLRIDYQAPQGCRAADAFLDEIRWRTPLVRVAAPGEQALEVEARITRRGTTSSGHLVLGQGRDRIVRDIDGESCDEVVSALALVTALAVDPRASTAAKPPPAAPPADAAPAPPAPPPPAAFPPPPPRILADPLPVIPEDSPVAALATTPWVLGARGMVDVTVAPRPLLGGGLFAERAFEGWWHPSLRLSLSLGSTGGFETGPGGASFLRGLGRIEGCGLAWRPASWVSLAPCLGVEAGAVHAEGILEGALTYVRQTTSFWAGGSALPRVAIDLGPVVLDLQGGPIFPMVRPKFVFQTPAYPIWSLPSVTWTAAIGIGVHFP